MPFKKSSLVLVSALILLCSCADTSKSIGGQSPSGTRQNSETTASIVEKQNSGNGADASQQLKTATGVVEDLSMNQIWVTLENGDEINFVSEYTDLSSLDSYKPGDKITIHYSGDLKSNFKVLKLTSEK